MIDRYTPDEETLEGMRKVDKGAFVLYTDHIAEVCKLRDKLMECAKECSECNGTGVITLNFRTFGKVIHEDCPACHDIRSVLA